MPSVNYKISPGIIKDTTELEVGSSYWTDGDKVRFRFGQPEPIGGWTKETNWSFNGVPRKSKSWQTNNLDNVTAYGTNSHLYIVFNNQIHDITPLRKTSSSLLNPFSTISGSTLVTVTDSSHGAFESDYVVILGASTVNGITLDGEYQIVSVTDTNNYVVDSGTSASGTGSGGGTVDIEYLISTGTNEPIIGLGWGADTWSSGAWSDPAISSNIISQETRMWSIDTWGEDLISCPLNGGIYIWDASSGPNTRSILLANAPSSARFIIVSSPDRHVVAFGCDNGSFQDYMNIAWCDQENNTEWVASATNTAGDFRLNEGTRIVAAVNTQDTILILTDEAAFQQYFQGPPFTFGFRPVGSSCGAISQNCLVDIAGIPHWVGIENFYQFVGQVKTLACPIRRFVFDNLNKSRADKVFSGVNEKYQEWWFFYPSLSSEECDRFGIFNYAEGHWSIGTLSRTTWNDRESYQQNPVATDQEGNAYYHEVGRSDSGSPIQSYVESGYIDLEANGVESERLLRVDKYIPDFQDLVGTIQFTITTRKYPQANEIEKGPFDIDSSTEKISFRAKGRQFKIKLESNEVNAKWRPGKQLLNVFASSKR